MLRIAICDDEKSIIDQVEKYINTLENELHIVTRVNTYLDYNALEYDITEKISFDIVFMDIQFDDVDGIEVAEFIKSESSYSSIIFMTGYYEKVYDVFSARPTGFIRKPISYEDFKNEFMRAIEECSRQDIFEYTSGKTLYRVVLNDIIYFRSEKRKVYIRFKDEQREFYGKLDEVQLQISGKNDDFYRVSQSYLVNTNYVTSIKYDSLMVRVGLVEEEVKITQDYRKNIKKKYMKNLDE